MRALAATLNAIIGNAAQRLNRSRERAKGTRMAVHHPGITKTL